MADIDVTIWRDPESGGRATDGNRVARVASGKDGVFRCTCDVVDAATFTVVVGGDTHVQRARSFGPYSASREVDLGAVSLRTGIRLVTRFVDDLGAPIPGMRINASLPLQPPQNETLTERWMTTGCTDEDGRVAWSQLMLPGRYWVHSTDKQELPFSRIGAWMPVDVSPATQTTTIVWPLEDITQSIIGTLVDEAGTPIAGVDIGVEGGGTRGNCASRIDGTFSVQRIGPFDPLLRGPVQFGLPTPTDGFQLLGEPSCNWGDRQVKLVVRPAATLVVRAIDAGSREVVRGFEVACAACVEGSEPAIAHVRPQTNEHRSDGTVRRYLASLPHHVQVFPHDNAYAPSIKTLWDPSIGQELVVQLFRTRPYTVRIVATDGTPVADTTVWAMQPIEATVGSIASMRWQPTEPPSAEALALNPTSRWATQGIGDAPLDTARTTIDGYATLRVPVEADVILAALGPGHSPAAIVGRAMGDAAELRVSRGATLHVEFTPSRIAALLAPPADQLRLTQIGARGAALPGSTLWISRVADDDASRLGSPEIVALTNDSCSRSGLPPGRYKLQLGNRMTLPSGDGVYLRHPLGEVALKDGATHTFVGDLSTLVTGKVHGQVLVNGAPAVFVGGALHSDGPAGSRSWVPIMTDDRGHFACELTAGRCRLQLNHRGTYGHVSYWWSLTDAEVKADETTHATFAMRSATARVRVVDAQGAPVPGLVVALRCQSPWNRLESWMSDDDGWIEIELAPPVPFHLAVSDPNRPVVPGRRSSPAYAELGPFEIPVTGQHIDITARLPESWR